MCGAPRALRRAEQIGFVEGSNWDERLAGTNAPGLALRLDRSSSVIAAEHFRRSVQQWSCAASPIHDPGDSRLLGVLDIMGGDSIVVPRTMAMVRAAARLAESELAREMLLPTQPETRPGWARIAVETLGRHDLLLSIDDRRGHRAQLRLSPRHSEIFLVLASAPRRLSGDELAVLLYEDDGGSSTLRAEMNRPRNLLGEDFLASRPYRITAEVTGDWLAVEARLAAGDVAGALRCYRGPILPRSIAPGVVRLRETLSQQLRAAVRQSRQPDLISTWTRSSWGADDYEMWLGLQELLPNGSPLSALADGQLARLDRESGL